MSRTALDRLVANVENLAETFGLANMQLRERLALDAPASVKELPAVEVPAPEVPATDATSQAEAPATEETRKRTRKAA